MSIYSSDSDSQDAPVAPRLFGRQRLLHSLGGGKLAEVMLWRNKSLFAGILVGVTILWFLFQVVEYNFVSLFFAIFLFSFFKLVHGIRDMSVKESRLDGYSLNSTGRSGISLNTVSSGEQFQFFESVIYRISVEVDHLTVKGNKDAKKLYEKFVANVLNKIPRGPVKQNKFR